MPKTITTKYQPQIYTVPPYICEPDGTYVSKPIMPELIFEIPSSKEENPVKSTFTSNNNRCNNAVKLAEQEWDPYKIYETDGENRGKDIIRYRYGQNNDFAWCADFFNYLYNPNHIEGQNILGMSDKDVRSTQKIMKRAKALGCFAPTKNNYKIQVGDGLIWRSDTDSMKGHIGIVVEVRDDGSFVTIQGNNNDKVEKIEYSSIQDAMIRTSSSGNTQTLQGFLQMSKYNNEHNLSQNNSSKNSNYYWVA